MGIFKDYLPTKNEPPKIVYHYCSMDTFYSIMRNKCLWLSDASKTNDKTELSCIVPDFLSIFNEIYKEYVQRYQPDKAEEMLSTLVETHDIINKFYWAPNYNQMMSKYFISCFSTKGDLLSQWRAYGNDGYGASIGFDSKWLRLFRNESNMDFTEVVYKKVEINAFIRQSLECGLQAVFTDPNFKLISKNTDNMDPDEYIKSFQFKLGPIINQVLSEGYRFKDSAFKEEQEWRLFLTSDHGAWDDIINGVSYGDFFRSGIKFSARNDCLVPRVEFSFENMCSGFIKKIYLGPKCKSSKLDIKLFLSSNGYYGKEGAFGLVDKDDIQFEKSSIPYI